MITRSSLSSITSRILAALVFAVGAALLSSAVVPTSAGATTLRRLASSDSSAAGQVPAGASTSTMEVGYYDLSQPYPNGSGNGDNLLRLINPTAASGTICANLYVFNNEEELGECCSCPVSPNGLEQISVKNNLVDNGFWLLGGPLPASGTIIETSSAADGETPLVDSLPQCDPRQALAPPAASGSTAESNIIGYITHNQAIPSIAGPLVSSLTEVPLYDQGTPDATEAAYLAQTCALIVSEGSNHTGVCCCGPNGINPSPPSDDYFATPFDCSTVNEGPDSTAP